MLLIEVLILAVVQGIAEFLPISSSGHLVVGEALLDQFGHPIEEKLGLVIVLHVGTLAAILVFYWQRIWRLLDVDRRVIGLLVVGSLPAAVVGLTIKGTAWGKTLEGGLENPLLAGLMFPITGVMLLWAARHEGGQTTCREMGFSQAFVIGLLQAVAILPGISRSGATIVAGLGCGLRRDESAAFSFLLAVPAIAGAGLLEYMKLAKHGPGPIPMAGLLLGAVASFLVGLAALWWLIRWINQGRLSRFAWYVIPLGAIVVVWQAWQLLS
jgi:undecaprenyl-diphosphatase